MLVGTVQKLGKNINKDEEMNKCNFITMYGIERCEVLCKRLTKECIELLNRLSVNATYLKALTFNLLEREY